MKLILPATDLLLEQDAAHLVNTASIFGVFAGALGPYGVSKHAVVALTETLAGPRSCQVRPSRPAPNSSTAWQCSEPLLPRWPGSWSTGSGRRGSTCSRWLTGTAGCSAGVRR
jgi:hypothetical protein